MNLFLLFSITAISQEKTDAMLFGNAYITSNGRYGTALISPGDNDYVEVYNDNGVYVTRANVSARVKRGTTIIYHSPERTYMPKSRLRNIRGGGHNSLTRIRLNPVLVSGGYGQFTFGFNYWGPVAVNRDTFVYIKKMDADPEW